MKSILFVLVGSEPRTLVDDSGRGEDDALTPALDDSYHVRGHRTTAGSLFNCCCDSDLADSVRVWDWTSVWSGGCDGWRAGVRCGLEILVWAWVEPEAGWGTGVSVVQGYVVVLFLSVSVNEDYTPKWIF